MKYIHYLYIGALAFLAACSSEETATTTAHPDGAIQLSAGIVECGAQAVTRTGAEDHHDSPGHLTLTNGTKLALQVSGTWTGHSPSDVVKTTTATVGAETSSGSKHNAVSCNPVLYWDDYGTADPANAETGRATGLTIYGVAINGKTDAAPAVENYTALSWTLAADQTGDDEIANTDLLISNNVKAGTGDGPYKFADYIANPTTYTKLLEFTHAMSKVTVNLKAGTGISADAFNNAVVKLTSNTTTEWAYTTGTVNITDGTVTGQGNPAAITMKGIIATSGYQVTTEALVMPGSELKPKSGNDYPIIVSANVNGNIYYITSEKIRKAINSSDYTNSEAFLTEPGKNYIINVNISNTGINVTATVTDWVTVTAEEVSPVINVSADFGSSSSAMSNAFSFYRSTSLDNGYGSLVQGKTYYAKDSEVSKSGENWTMYPLLYWPDHNTHYQFRGVLPKTVITDATTSPRVENGIGTTSGYQIIKVWNEAYNGTADHFPSNLQIARPEIAASEKCSNSDHTPVSLYDVGICATEGKINLNFRYMMSQVEVNLSTTTGTDAVNLPNAKVEITNVYSTGDVKLGDRGVITTGNTGAYTLSDEFSVSDGSSTINKFSHPNRRWSAVVPQTLTYSSARATTNVQFKITIYKEGSTTEVDDIYYADIAPIKKENTTDYVAKYVSGTPGTWYWESGVHYVYNLKLSKTKINVTATLANWTKVTANENVWF